MTEAERAVLETHLDWLLNDVIPGFEASEQPPSWKVESLRRVNIQVANIEWRLNTGNPAPLCGYAGLYSEHDPNCHYCKTGKSKRGYAIAKVSEAARAE